MGRCLFGFLATKHGLQGGTLVGVGALVDDHLQLTVSFENGARPLVKKSRAEPIEPGLSEMAFVDLKHLEALAVSVGGQGFELTRAGIVTNAVAEGNPFDQPIDFGHVASPISQLWHLKTRALFAKRIPRFHWPWLGDFQGAA